MNLEDESHLSAYLDDQLDPADRLAVEWSVESSGPMADQLRSIALARDAVSGLARPDLPRDLAPFVVARIAADRRRARSGDLARPARITLAVAGFASIAASLIFALILLNGSLHETPDRPELAARDVPAPAPRTHHPIAAESTGSAPDAEPTPHVPAIVRASSPVVSPAAPPGAIARLEPFAPSSVGPSGRRDRRVVAEILERPHVRRIVIVTDVVDAPEKVRALIRQDARRTPEYGRITIAQELVLDPERPEAAEVFAVPMDERGRRSFVERLQGQFPGLIEEGQSSPDLVARLGRVGEFAVFRGAEAAPLGEPPLDLRSFIANREGSQWPDLLAPSLGPFDPPGSDPGRSGLADGGAGPGLAVASGPRPARVTPEFVGPPDLDRKAPPRPGEKLTLLVWVVARPRRG